MTRSRTSNGCGGGGCGPSVGVPRDLTAAESLGCASAAGGFGAAFCALAVAANIAARTNKNFIVAPENKSDDGFACQALDPRIQRDHYAGKGNAADPQRIVVRKRIA